MKYTILRNFSLEIKQIPLTKEGPFYSHLCSEFHIFIHSGDTLSVSETKLHSSGPDDKSNHPDYGSQTYITEKNAPEQIRAYKRREDLLWLMGEKFWSVHGCLPW